MMKVLANGMVLIILQYKSVSSQHVVHPKFIQFICQSYLNKVGGNVNYMSKSLICPAGSFGCHCWRLRTNTSCALHVSSGRM